MSAVSATVRHSNCGSPAFIQTTILYANTRELSSFLVILDDYRAACTAKATTVCDERFVINTCVRLLKGGVPVTCQTKPKQSKRSRLSEAIGSYRKSSKRRTGSLVFSANNKQFYHGERLRGQQLYTVQPSLARRYNNNHKNKNNKSNFDSNLIITTKITITI